MTKSDIVWCEQGWQPVRFCFVPSSEAWDKLKVELTMEEDYPDNDGCVMTFEDTDTGQVICAVTFKDDIENTMDAEEIIGLIVHEATHVWQEILKAMGEEDPSPEFEAYSMQCITIELLMAFQMTRGYKNEG